MYLHSIITIFSIFVKCILSFKIDNIYLSKSQWQRINSLIKNPELTHEMRDKINNIIYYHYSNYALSKAYKFKMLHKHKCQSIKLDELQLYSNFGLYKAIEKYNGNSFFINYVDKYITWELYKGLTDLHPLSNIPKSYRRKGITKRTDSYNYKERMNTKFIGCDDNWFFDKQFNDDYNYHLDKRIHVDEKNRIIDFVNTNLDGFSKQVFNYKYHDDFNVVRKNKHLAELLDCSEEKIRTTVINIKKLFKDRCCKNL
jgi:DNA-directed RNA polymerase specialized sigma subunit